jgi:hypothetical protein
MKLLKGITVKAGNIVEPLMIEANRLGLEGWSVLEIKLIESSEETKDVLTVEVYGEKVEM